MENEIDSIWLSRAKEEVVKIDTTKLLSELDSQLKCFDRNIKKRNLREYIAATIVILVFGTGAFLIPVLLSKIGLTIVALYGIMVVLVLRNANKYKPDNYSLPTSEYLVKHREYLVKERNLLKNVIFWYILPPFVGCVIFIIGQNRTFPQMIISILIIFGINAFIYMLNKYAVKKYFNPLVKKMDDAINEFNSTEC
jgi:Ca2+/Na+ antiporter